MGLDYRKNLGEFVDGSIVPNVYKVTNLSGVDWARTGQSQRLPMQKVYNGMFFTFLLS